MMSRRSQPRNNWSWPGKPYSRRELLRLGSLGLLGVSLPDLLARRAQTSSAAHSGSFGRAKACILLFMWGGPAHQDTWDLKPGAPAEIRGEFRPIATNVSGIEICEHFPRLAQRADKLAIVRSVTHGDVNHTSATHYLLTGHAPPPGGDIRRDWPSIGAVLAKLSRGSGVLPPFVSMRPKVPGDVPRFVEESQGQFAGWLGPSFDPLTIDSDPATDDYEVGAFQMPADVSLTRLTARRDLLQAVNQQVESVLASPAAATAGTHYQKAFELLHAGTAGSAFDLTQEPNAVRDRYGRNTHGQSVLQARRLVERGVPLVTVFWPNDGIKNVSVYWDTHSRNFIDLKDRLMPAADQAFAALLDDLSERGMLDETLVIWTGEFGRTPRVGQVNSDAGAGADGRDHWPGCFSTVLAGGGIRGGQVYGASDRHAAYPAENAVAPLDLVATAYHCLGVPSERVLYDSQDRPLVVSGGRVIAPLVG